MKVGEYGALGGLTDINVPGKKKSVTSVIIFIETVSFLVLMAKAFIWVVISCISSVEACALSAESKLACIFL